MIFQNTAIYKEGEYYKATLGTKTFYRAKLSNLETIINMYNQGGDLRDRVNLNIPEQREEWIASQRDVTLPTGRVVEVITKTPTHPDEGYKHVFKPYEYVPEFGKGLAAVEARSKLVHETEYPDAPSLLDRVIGVGAGSVAAIKGIKLPDFPKISTPFKAMGTVVILFIVLIIALIALGYSGLGGATGEITKGEYQKRRG